MTDDKNISGDSFCQLSQTDAFKLLNCGEYGLTPGEAKLRLKKFGRNLVSRNVRNPGFRLFLSQFKSPVTVLLIIAALLSAGLGDVADTVIILIIVLISSLLGFWQERSAANAVQELLKLVRLHCDVLRGGTKTAVTIDEAVPGDILMLAAGDIIPGDCLVLNAQELFTDEAAFTGETYPVEKKATVLPERTPLSKRSNTLLMGSHVISGKAKALIVRTGKQTEFGKIAAGLQSAIPPTAFEKGIRRFGYLLMELTLLLVLIIFAINVYLHKPALDSLLFSLALAVGLTPQLLPAIISVNLAAGARRMAASKVIVKRLSSIENLGSMDILCSDKTGTITEGKVTLKDTLDAAGGHSEKVLQYGWLNAALQQGFHNPVDEAICRAYQGEKLSYMVQTEIPYDFIRKRLTVRVKNDRENLAITKGALSVILSICSRVEDSDGKLMPMPASRDTILQQYEALSAAGLRTLGLAYKPCNEEQDFTKEDERDMIFLGFITLFDPPKEDVAQTIANLTRLGVKLKIITGDNALVAKSLAMQIGITHPKILTGAGLQKMSNAALSQQAPLTHIFAEVEPNQKERIISVLKKKGHVVGFMGDGINDAPALHIADVGISVNTAVDVAKEAADIVLLSRDLAVLTEGVIEGRKTFANTMKYIFMATSANFGNMFSMAGVSVFLPFLPMLPKQILLTNLLTDLPEMAIATDRVDRVNTASPQHWDLGFIKRFMIVFGLLSSVFDYLTFGVLLLVLHVGEKNFQTGWFVESVISATLIVLVVRTRLPFFKSLPGRYLFGATLFVLITALLLPLTAFAGWFGFSRLPASYYGWMLMVLFAYMMCAELAKSAFYRWFAARTVKGQANG